MAAGRVLGLVGGALVFFFVVFGLVVFLTRSEDGVAVDNLLSEDLTRQIQLAEGRGEDQIDLRRIASDFRWDRMCIAQPNTPKEVLEDALGHGFDGETNRLIGLMLVFSEDGRLARFADYRGRGAFEGIEEPVACFARDEAVFNIRGLVLTPSGE